MKKLYNSKGGFTLVEVLVVIIIMTIISTVVYQLFDTTTSLNRSIGSLNDNQNTLSDVVYRLRVSMADAKNAKSYNVDLDTFNPDTDIYDDGYTYIVNNKDGGFTKYWYDSGVRMEERFGVVDEARGYKVYGKFKTSATGVTTIDLITRSNDAPADGSGDYLYISTTLDLRASDTDGEIGNVIKFEAS